MNVSDVAERVTVSGMHRDNFSKYGDESICSQKPIVQSIVFAFLYYIFRQFTGLVTIERDIKKAFKTFFFDLVLECLQAQGEGRRLP